MKATLRAAALAGTVSLFALAAPALAQDASVPVDDAAVTSPDEAPPGEIVVTAQKRTERLQDVPVAVSVLGADALATSSKPSLESAVQLVPSLNFVKAGTALNQTLFLRGLGTTTLSIAVDPSVSTVLDGVVLSRSAEAFTDLVDIERIEVLRGPQGTLFGRNASAGLIHVISKKPNMNAFEGYGELTYGNYDFLRASGGITGPLGESGLGFRLDGVYVQRDGFYRVENPQNGTESRVNDRDRYFVRGQLMYEPSDNIEFRLIGDYTKRDESCCGAVFVETRESFDPTPTGGQDFAFAPSNRIVDILRSLGETFPSVDDPYSRVITVTPGRTYRNDTEDYGVSGQIDWDFGAASLTSITAYRHYKSEGAADIDYGRVDITYRAADGNVFRRFNTFSQELRLQGSAFNDRLDWLVGGYYANEDLLVADNTKFGTQYGAFAACRIVATINPTAALRNPANPGCLSPAGRATLTGAFAPLGPAGAALLAGIDRLSTVNNVGDQRSNYFQDSENYAFFTHNIFKVTDKLSLTLGARYTKEQKDFSAEFNNNNTVCNTQQSALGPLLTNTAIPVSTRTLIGGIITLTCTGNSSTELNGLDLEDSFSDDEWTGTAVLSYKPDNNTLLYASYSKGYKAGGYNLDRSDLGSVTEVRPGLRVGTRLNSDAARLRFAAEKVDAYEIGAKVSGPRGLTFNIVGFRQDFQDFQLNTFNGTVFIVQNINSCSTNLNGADRDPSAATGACSPDDVQPGVRSEGVEIEMSGMPAPDLRLTAGYTYANTRYKRNLIGSSQGEALDPFLFNLPGQNLSNAPEHVLTGTFAYTPEFGPSGLSGLFYVDARYTSDFNTGSDLFPEKEQNAFVIVNGRVGIRGPDERWAVELWAQNLFDQNYYQVAFNTPFQGANSRAQVAQFGAPLGFGTGNQLFSAFLAEPRTYGLTVRGRF